MGKREELWRSYVEEGGAKEKKEGLWRRSSYGDEGGALGEREGLWGRGRSYGGAM